MSVSQAMLCWLKHWQISLRFFLAERIVFSWVCNTLFPWLQQQKLLILASRSGSCLFVGKCQFVFEQRTSLNLLPPVSLSNLNIRNWNSEKLFDFSLGTEEPWQLQEELIPVEKGNASHFRLQLPWLVAIFFALTFLLFANLPLTGRFVCGNCRIHASCLAVSGLWIFPKKAPLVPCVSVAANFVRSPLTTISLQSCCFPVCCQTRTSENVKFCVQRWQTQAYSEKFRYSFQRTGPWEDCEHWVECRSRKIGDHGFFEFQTVDETLCAEDECICCGIQWTASVPSLHAKDICSCSNQKDFIEKQITCFCVFRPGVWRRNSMFQPCGVLVVQTL